MSVPGTRFHDQMLDQGLLDEPGLANVVGGYNRMFKAEYVDDDGDDDDEWVLALPGVEYLRDELEALLVEYPAIGDNYAGPWETTGMWDAFTHGIEDQAELDAMRLQVPYKDPAIAPEDKVDSGTGMTGLQVITDDETMTMYHDLGWNTVLACSKEPGRHFPQARIQLVRFTDAWN